MPRLINSNYPTCPVFSEHYGLTKMRNFYTFFYVIYIGNAYGSKTSQVMHLRFLIVACCFCFWQCDSSKDNPTPAELTIQYINQIRPQLVGTWQLRQAQIDAKKQVSVYYSTGITKDTVLPEVATLTLVPWSGEVADERVLHLGGTLRFKAKDHPIHVKLYPIQNNTKTKGTLFIDFNYKQGTSVDAADTDYLYAIGLVGDNFNVETELGGSVMIWKGLNRAIVAASFAKNK